MFKIRPVQYAGRSLSLIHIFKYCDKVILLNKGEFIAEGSAGKMVDMYKKILAGQMASLEAELKEMHDFSGDKVVVAEKQSESGKNLSLIHICTCAGPVLPVKTGKQQGRKCEQGWKRKKCFQRMRHCKRNAGRSFRFILLRSAPTRIPLIWRSVSGR